MNPKIKIFFHHPKILNYRVPFFKFIDNEFDLTLFLKQSNVFDKEFKKVFVTKRNKIITAPIQIIPIQDLILMIKKVKSSDIIISSFSIDFYTLVLRFISVIYRKRLITWEEGREKPDNFIQLLKWTFEKITLKFSDLIFTLGANHKDTFIKMGIKKQKIFVANEYPAFDYSKLNQKEITLPFNNNKKIILYFGRIIKIKGIIYLINAFSEIQQKCNDFTLLIIGDGDDKINLINHVKNNSIDNITFMDSIYDEEVKSYIFKKSYIGILPSIKYKNGWSEGGPLVLLEFLSSGLPVIGSDMLGSSNQLIIEGVNGYTVPQKSSEHIKNTIIQLDIDIQSGIITKDKVYETFHKIPDHKNQYRILKNAINYVLSEK